MYSSMVSAVDLLAIWHSPSQTFLLLISEKVFENEPHVVGVLTADPQLRRSSDDIEAGAAYSRCIQYSTNSVALPDAARVTSQMLS